MMLLLLKVFGVRRVAGWALRLAKIIVWMGMLVGLGLVLWLGGEQAFERILFYWVVALVILGLRALWRRRHKTQEPEAPQAERTIDGKRVPDKLAMAAFAVPSYSSDGDSVLRGLPDYGKALLKLDGGEFAYVPEPPGREPKLLELTVVEPATPDSPFAVLRWVGAGAVVVCLVVAGVVIQSARSEVSRDRARIQDMAEQASPQPVAAAEIGQGSTPAPPQVTLTPLPAPAATLDETENAAPAADASPSSTQTEIQRLFGSQGGDKSAAAPNRAVLPPPVKDSAPGVLLTHVNPVYPPEAKAQHIEGVVVLNAVIGKTGEVTEVSVVSGPEELQKAAVDAVKQWTYKPYIHDGEPSEVDTTIRLRFTFGGL